MTIQQQHQQTKGLVGQNLTPIIAGVEITTDECGRFNLNALHRASREANHKRPSKWLDTDQANALIGELQKNQSPISGLAQKVVNVIKGGAAPGTFAHELLAISYAGWISPAFQLQVNQVFLDYRTGKLTPVADPMAILNDPASMRGLLLSYSEKVLALEERVGEMAPVVQAFDRIATAEGSLNLTEAAKVLQVPPRKLTAHLQASRWIYKRPGARNWLGYQDKVQQGLLEHKLNTYLKGDGSEGLSEQVRILPKGITKLAQTLSIGGVQ